MKHRADSSSDSVEIETVEEQNDKTRRESRPIRGTFNESRSFDVEDADIDIHHIGSPLEGVSLASFAGCTELDRLDVRNTGMSGAELAEKLQVLEIVWLNC